MRSRSAYRRRAVRRAAVVDSPLIVGEDIRAAHANRQPTRRRDTSHRWLAVVSGEGRSDAPVMRSAHGRLRGDGLLRPNATAYRLTIEG